MRARRPEAIRSSYSPGAHGFAPARGRASRRNGESLAVLGAVSWPAHPPPASATRSKEAARHMLRRARNPGAGTTFARFTGGTCPRRARAAGELLVSPSRAFGTFSWAASCLSASSGALQGIVRRRFSSGGEPGISPIFPHPPAANTVTDRELRLQQRCDPHRLLGLELRPLARRLLPAFRLNDALARDLRAVLRHR